MLSRRSAFAVTLAVLLAGCAVRQPGDPLRPGFNLFSKEQDVQLGQEAAQEIRQQVHVVDNQALQNYINSLGQRLARTPEAGEYPYNFTLINDKSVNAFALPGGPIFVHTGLVLAADNEGQLVGVLAHEVAHVALRHGTSQVTKANIAQLPALLASAAIGDASILAQLGQVGIGLGFNSLLMSYSRGAETEADALGARMMAKAGYDPIEMARFFEKLQAEGGARAPQFLSSHPNPGNRMKAVQQEIGHMPPARYDGDTGQFQRMKSLISQLPPPQKK